MKNFLNKKIDNVIEAYYRKNNVYSFILKKVNCQGKVYFNTCIWNTPREFWDKKLFIIQRRIPDRLAYHYIDMIKLYVPKSELNKNDSDEVDDLKLNFS